MADVVVTLNANFHQVCVDAALPQLETKRKRMQNKAEQYCPVDTGYLRNSVYSETNRTTGDIEIGATATYAAAIEYGHVTRSGSFVPAQPFIRRAVYEELQ
jgi:phage gpG-like protein